jgi:hypothetical protein
VFAEGIPHFSENAYMLVTVEDGFLFDSDDGDDKFFPEIGDILLTILRYNPEDLLFLILPPPPPLLLWLHRPLI